MIINLTERDIKECQDFLTESEEYFWGFSPDADELDIELANDGNADTWEFMNN